MDSMTLEEALAAATVDDTSENRVLVIDSDLRTIEIPGTVKNLGVESDDDVNRLHFQMPKTYGEFDLSTFDIRINYKNGNIGDVYAVEDKAIEGDVITFSWLVGRNAVKMKGTTQFIVCLKKSDSSGVVQQEFNTTVASLNVLEGLETTEQVVQENTDIIEQILKKIDGLTSISPEDIANAVEEYMAAHPFTETDPTVPDWAKQPEKPTYTASEVGADAAGTAESKVSEHNVDLDAHNDIRLLVQGLTTRLNALADSDDTTLDQMSEVVAYIKSNKSLIDAITTSKINVSDIIDNLTTNVSNKPISAAQGVKLKALIDAIIVPTKLSELENDSGYAKTTDIPDKLPNPQKLTFSGAVTAEYDGSSPIEINIPEGGGTGGDREMTVLVNETISLEEAVSTISFDLGIQGKTLNRFWLELVLEPNTNETNVGGYWQWSINGARFAEYWINGGITKNSIYGVKGEDIGGYLYVTFGMYTGEDFGFRVNRTGMDFQQGHGYWAQNGNGLFKLTFPSGAYKSRRVRCLIVGEVK